jgi:restriction endonuclease Mrr
LEAELFDEVLNAEGQPPNPNFGVGLFAEQVRRLSPDRFEALTALLLEGQGGQVLLTPYSGDEGIDVIAVRGTEISLVQCKHTLWDAIVDVDAIGELISAFDGYRARRLQKSSRGRAIRPVLVTNGTLSSTAKAFAAQRQVQFIESAELQALVGESCCSFGSVEAMEHRRLASMRDVQAALKEIEQPT